MIGRLLAVVIGVAGLVAGSQAPNYTQNFMQNLEGRIDERERDYNTYRSLWERRGQTRQSALADCERGPDSYPRDTCLYAEVVVRVYERLTTLQTRLRDADPLERPVVLAEAIYEDECSGGLYVNALDLDPELGPELCLRDLAMNVLEEYKVAVPATTPAAAYGGGLAGTLWVVFRLIFGILGMPFRRRESYY